MKMTTIFTVIAMFFSHLTQATDSLTMFRVHIEEANNWYAQSDNPRDFLYQLTTFGNPLDEKDLVDFAVAEMKKQVAAHLEMEVLPMNTLKNGNGKRIIYNDYNYPNATKKRAITHQTSEYFGHLSIRVDLNRRLEQRVRKNLWLFEDYTWHQDNRLSIYRPKVTLDLTIFDKNGEKVKKLHLNYRSPETMRVLDVFTVKDEGVTKYKVYAEDTKTTLNQLMKAAMQQLFE